MPTQSRAGQFDQRLDLDYFKVSLVAGERYLFRMVPGTASATQRPTLELFAPDSADTGFNPAASDSRVLLLNEAGEARFAFVAPASGTWYLRATQSPIDSVPRTDTGSYTVSISDIALDDHADLPAQGTLLAIGTPHLGQFDERRDLDYFRLDLAEGQRVLLAMNGSGLTPVVNNALDVRSPDGTSLVIDSHATDTGGAKIAFVAPAAGVYQVLARPWAHDTGSGLEQHLGGYQIGATALAADDHADLRAQGTLLGAGASVAGQFDQRHDLDWFKVTLTAGQRYLLSMNGSGGAPIVGSEIALFAPDGTAIETIGDPLDDANNTANGGAKFSYVARESGMHFLLATLGQGNAGGDTGSYSVSLANLALDDHSDLPAQGTVLAIGATLAGQFDQRYDLDQFKVSLVQGQRYTFTMKAGASNGVQSAFLSLTDPDGVTYKVDFGIDLTAQIPAELRPFLPPGLGQAEAKFVYTAQHTGTHFLLAQVAQTYAPTGVATGSYTVAAAATTLDDHRDHWSQGTVLASDTTATGSFDFRHDEDYFRVELAAGARYLFTLTPTSGGLTDIVSMVMFTGAETQIGYDVSSSGSDPAKFSYVAPTGGTYYLRVEGQQAFSLGASATQTYSLRYTALALDDHSDLREQGTVLREGAPVNRLPEVADGSASVAEDAVLNATLPAATDADSDALTYAKASDPAHGSVAVAANGTYVYTPVANYHGSDSFGFTVSDGRGGSTTRTMTLSVTPVNDAPAVAQPLGDQSATGGSAFGLTLPMAAFADADGDALTLAATRGDGSALPGWLAFDAATRTFSGTPGNADAGTLTVKVTASDGSASAVDEFVIAVARGANRAPVISGGSGGSGTLAEDAVRNGQLPAATDADGDAVSYAKASDPAHGSVVVNADGSYRYTPAANYNGSDAFGFSVSDGQGGSTSYSHAITVTPVNDAPVGSVGFSGTARQFERLVATTAFTDADGVGPLGYEWLRGGAPIPGATGSDYLLSAADVGFTIGVRVSYTDGGGTRESLDFGSTGVVAGPNSVGGTSGNDRLLGTDGRDGLFGGGGDDVLIGFGGSDTLDGGDGYDVANYGPSVGGFAAMPLGRGSARAVQGDPGGPGGAGEFGAVPFVEAVQPIQLDMRTGSVIQGADADTLLSIEVVFGTAGNDTLRGADAPANRRSDTLRGGGGDDAIDGGGGVDSAEFTGGRAGYTITRSGNQITVVDDQPGNGDEGRDTLTDVERLVFADKLIAFGSRAEDVARVAFVLWTPDIVGSGALFARGLSYYDVGYDFLEMCGAALQFWDQQGAAFADLLLRGTPGTTKTQAEILQIMSNAGGGQAGRIAALAEMARDAATTAQLELRGVTTSGVAADLEVAGFGTLFQLWPNG